MSAPVAQTNGSSESTMELRIPNPFGHYAAKVWGPEQGIPVLAIHGWLDNAGTFDRLVPLLDPRYRVVCLEMPGHGFSSHKPPGQLYHFMEGLVDIRRVLDHLKWDRVILMGHSMGCALSIMFTALYPERVSALIGLDLVKPVLCRAEKLTGRNRAGIDEILGREGRLRSDRAPIYTREDALQRLIQGLGHSVTEESAQVLMKRGTIPENDDPNKVTFARDLRLRDLWALSTFTDETCAAYLKNISAELLLVLANNSIFSRDLDEVMPFYQHKSRRIQVARVDGTHFVHLNNPDRVAPIINSFLEECVDLPGPGGGNRSKM